jgi:uncharacterized membrane protein
MSSRLVTLTAAAAIGSGVVGGVLFAFSTFIMNALNRLPATQSISAMQAINKAAPNALFMTALFGTAAACVALAIAALFGRGNPATTYQLAGSALYLLAVVVTIAYHVPRNNALATLDPANVDAARHWPTYMSRWTAWNHVRATASIAGAAVLTVGLRAR